MNFVKGNICCGCLANDRKITVLDESIKDFYVQIVNLQKQQTESLADMVVCWECEALVRRFQRFQKQVQFTYEKILELFGVWGSVRKPILPPQSKLKTKNIFSIALSPTGGFEFTYDIIKTELPIESDIKEEHLPETLSDNISDNDFGNDSDNTLIEISKNKKKKRLPKNDEAELPAPFIYLEVELTSEQILEERQMMVLTEGYINAAFRCERCIVTFTNADDLAEHFSLKHDTSLPFKCPICECAFASEVSFNYHAHKHKRRYQCGVCANRFGTRRAAGKHYDFVHCYGTNLEYAPNKQSESQNGLIVKPEQISNDSEPTTFPCEHCAKSFKWKTSLRKHLETHRIETGQKRKPYCEPCRISFTNTANLQKHVKTSAKHQIQLRLGKRSAEDTVPIEEIVDHVNSSRKVFPCAQCDKKFQWRGNLLRHVKSHAARANGELVCVPCSRTFSSIATYKQHMQLSRKHVSEQDFKYMCNDCGAKFVTKTRLRDHVNWEHLSNYVHKCKVCQKAFKSHTSLYLHTQVVHKKHVAEHLCDHCGKAFPNHTKLRTHIAAVHSAESPYSCAQCAARFSWHSCLSRHVRRVHKQ